jgi:hypothetical protein
MALAVSVSKAAILPSIERRKSVHWTSRIPTWLRIAPILALTAFTLAGCGSDDDGPGPGPGATTFAGVAAGTGGTSGSINVTVATATPAPAGPARITRPLTVVNATGTFTLNGGSAIALTGTYDDQTNVLVVTGGGYAFTGVYANGVISGTFTGPGGVDGAFSMQVSTGVAARAYCGEYTSDVGGGGGTFNLVVTGATVSGVAWDVDSDTATPLIGTRLANDSLYVSIASTTTQVAAGTVSSDSATVSGVYSIDGDTGTWSGGLCGTGTGAASYRGIAAGHEESGGLELSVASGSGPSLPATGNYRIAGGSTIALSGTYNITTQVFDLSGGGYQFTGAYVSAGRQQGTWTSATSDGQWVTATENAQLDTYCGTFTSNTGGDDGHLGVVLNGNVVTGVAVSADPTATVVPLDGIVSGNVVTIYFPATTDQFATGVIATGGASITGTYDDQAGEAGDWTAQLCPSPPTLVARLQAGVGRGWRGR